MKSRVAVIAFSTALAIAVVGFMLADRFRADAPGLALRPGDLKLLALGERVYTERCAACHGAGLEGQANWRSPGPDGLLPAPPHDASGHTWHHPDETLFRITKFGVAQVAQLKDYKSAMPVYDGVLSDEEIIAVLSWIKSRWPPSVRDKHDQINAQSLKTSTR